jgi:voltage-gated sodium channel
VLLLLLFYIYAVMAVFGFGGNDPIHFGSLSLAMLSLFRAVTMDGWSDMMFINMYGCDHYGYDGMMEFCTQPAASPLGAAFFFTSFVITGSMIVLNFFIGVVLSSMEEVRQEAEELEAAQNRPITLPSAPEDLLALSQKLQEIQAEMQRIAAILATPENKPAR